MLRRGRNNGRQRYRGNKRLPASSKELGESESLQIEEKKKVVVFFPSFSQFVCLFMDVSVRTCMFLFVPYMFIFVSVYICFGHFFFPSFLFLSPFPLAFLSFPFLPFSRAQDQRLGAEQDQLPHGSAGTSSGNCQKMETCMVWTHATTACTKPSFRAPWRVDNTVVNRGNA